NGITGRMALSWAKGDVDGAGESRLPLSTVDPLKLVLGVGYTAPDDSFGGQIIATHSKGKERARTMGMDRAGGPDTICSGAPCYRPAGFTILDATVFIKPMEGLTL